MSILRSLISASSNQAAGLIAVAVLVNQCELIASVSHLPNSAQVRERNCCSVLAVTIIVDPRRVESIQIMSQATRADLPIPRPEATASLNISGISTLSLRWICVVISRKIFSCHCLGPSKSSRGVSFCPQGKQYLTKLYGLSLTIGDHSSVINSCSCCGLYFILLIHLVKINSGAVTSNNSSDGEDCELDYRN